VGDPGGFTSHIGVRLWDSRAITAATDDPDGWFSKDSSPFDFRVGGTTYLFSSLSGPAELAVEYWHIPTMTVIASLVVLAAGVVLLWFSLETKVLAVLAAALAVLFAGLFLPSLVYTWLLAGRLGIAGIVALWTVVWLLHIRRRMLLASPFAGRGTSAPPGPGAPTAPAAPVCATVVPNEPPGTDLPPGTTGQPGGQQP